MNFSIRKNHLMIPLIKNHAYKRLEKIAEYMILRSINPKDKNLEFKYSVRQFLYFLTAFLLLVTLARSAPLTAQNAEPVITAVHPRNLVPDKNNLVTVCCNYPASGTVNREVSVSCMQPPTGWRVIPLDPAPKGTAEGTPEDAFKTIHPGRNVYFLFHVNPGRDADEKHPTRWELKIKDKSVPQMDFDWEMGIFPHQDRKMLIIDTDPAMGEYLVNDIDDGLAIIYSAQQEKASIAGITLTWGNLRIRRMAFSTELLKESVPRSPIRHVLARRLGRLFFDNARGFFMPDTEMAHRNAIHLADHLRLDVPIVKGSENQFNPDASTNDEASEFIVSTINNNKGLYTILALGNLTNIANAIKKDSSIVENIREIYVVAGWFDNPLIPEWNIAFDPAAAEYVFKNAKRVTIVPFDATTKWLFARKEFDETRKKDNCMTRYVVDPIKNWLDSSISQLTGLADAVKRMANGSGLDSVSVPGFYPFDSVGAALCIDNDLFAPREANCLFYPVLTNFVVLHPRTGEVHSAHTITIDDEETKITGGNRMAIQYDNRPAATIVKDYDCEAFKGKFLYALTNPTPCQEPAISGSGRFDSTSLALVVDSSGSMEKNDPQRTRIYAGELVIDRADDHWQIGIVEFDSTANRLASGTPKDSRVLKESLQRIDSEGATDIQLGLAEGFRFLDQSSQEKRGIILLSDGKQENPNSSFDFDEYVAPFAAKGWPVYTIGLTGAADEVLLSRVAEMTGGKFKKADSAQDMVWIIDLILSEFKNEALVLLEDGKVMPGQPITFAFNLDSTVNDVTTTMSYPGSRLDFRLIDPSGMEISASDAAAGVKAVVGRIYSTISVNNPKVGKWQAQVIPIDVGLSGEPVKVKAAVNSPVRIEVIEKKVVFRPAQPIAFGVLVTGDVQPASISGSYWIASPTGGVEKFALLRDGRVRYGKTGTAGVYVIQVVVQGLLRSGESFSRMAQIHAVVSASDDGSGTITRVYGRYFEIGIGAEVGIGKGDRIRIVDSGSGQLVGEGVATTVFAGRTIVSISSLAHGMPLAIGQRAIAVREENH